MSSVLKPHLQRLDFLRGVRREEMIDGHIGRRDEHRLGMGQHVEAGLPVVMPHPRRPHAPEWHRFHVQVDVYLVDCAAAEREFADEAIDRALAAAEDEGRQRSRGAAILPNASSSVRYVSTGRIGPKTSSSMIRSSQLTG